MTDISQLLLDNFGVVSSAQIGTAGVSHRGLLRLIDSGTLTRLRHGWYAGPDANSLVADAVRAGGVLSGPAALQLRKVWIPPDQPVHVRVRRRKDFRPEKADQSFAPFALPRGRAVRMDRSVDRADNALLTSILTCSRDTGIVLADSTLNLKLLKHAQIKSVAEQAGYRGAQVLPFVSGSAESGTETLFRLWLVRYGIKFRAQVTIPLVGRVDFVIGERLVIEIDSRAHHTSSENFAKDRRRDRLLTAQGYRHIRLTYADVMYNLEKVGKDILTLIRRDEHRPKPLPRQQ